MKQTLIDILEEFCPDNVYLQGSLAEGEPFPEEFVTFWTNYTDDLSHFDNETISVEWNFSVCFYSTNPQSVADTPPLIIQELRKAGFVPQGFGYDLPVEEQTHTA